ncbi:MAG: hypothetical protein RSC33_06725 [Vagococcus sp.]
MRKRLLMTSLVLLGLGLTACGNKEKADTKDTTATSSTKVETSKESEAKQEVDEATFKGVISENPTLDEETVSLTFDKVEAVSDPDKILDTLNASGVTLLAPTKALDGFKAEDLDVGSTIEFTIESPAAMTYSIPPQIAGNSIKTIKVVD